MSDEDTSTTEDTAAEGAVDESTADDTTSEGEAEKDWRAEFEAQQRINRTLERRQKKDLARIQELEKATPPDAPKVDEDAIRADVEKRVTAKANERIVRAEVRAAATGRLADPADAAVFLNLADFTVGDDGAVDGQELADAIDELLRTKPHLAAPTQGGKRFAGSSDAGPRKVVEKTIDQQIAEAQAAGDTRLALSLTNSKLYTTSRN